MNATGAKGFAFAVIRKSSAQPIAARPAMAIVNGASPMTMIAIAKMIQGAAQATRANVSERRDGRCVGRGAASSAGSAKKSILGSATGSRPYRPRGLAVAKTPASGAELVKRRLERLAGEVGPELVAEDELRVGALPEQVVGYS